MWLAQNPGEWLHYIFNKLYRTVLQGVYTRCLYYAGTTIFKELIVQYIKEYMPHSTMLECIASEKISVGWGPFLSLVLSENLL
jgi:hypothetical protein